MTSDKSKGSTSSDTSNKSKGSTSSSETSVKPKGSTSSTESSIKPKGSTSSSESSIKTKGSTSSSSSIVLPEIVCVNPYRLINQKTRISIEPFHMNSDIENNMKNIVKFFSFDDFYDFICDCVSKSDGYDYELNEDINNNNNEFIEVNLKRKITNTMFTICKIKLFEIKLI